MAEMTGVFAFKQRTGILKSTDDKASDPRQLREMIRCSRFVYYSTSPASGGRSTW